jgi:hypothetical protein
MAQRVTVYRKYVDSKRKNYRWVIQLPAGIEAPERVYLVSARPLIVSELPATCEREAVRRVRELLGKKWFRRAVGGECWEALKRLLEGCGAGIEAERQEARAVGA